MSLDNIVKNTPLYQQYLKSPEGQNANWYGQADMNKLPSNAYILTGDKTPDFGGGQSPFGFVVQGGNILGRVKL